MQDPLLGQRLANYRIERLIGRGGMASVYYGWDAKLRRPVAIKVTDASHQDIAYAKRLVHEARMIARWRHDHVIQVYYADQSQSLYFFAMEFVDGLDLGDLMDRYHRAGELLPHADVVRIGRAIASGLDYAHQRGVIHRDVKPSNVLLALDGRIVLSDFGLALEVQQGTMGEVLGTPHYIAPEQARDSASTVPQSDLYALGVILYEMLTGSVPFDDPSPMSLALKHIAEQPPLPTSVNPELGIPVEAVLLKALSKAPEDRYQSGEVMMDALERALAVSQTEHGEGRFGSPIADVLASIAASRGTLPRESDEGSQTVTAPVRLAREKSAKRRRNQLLIIAAIGLAALAVIALGTIILNGLALVVGNASATQTVTASSPTQALGQITSAPQVTPTSAQPVDNPTIPAATDLPAPSPTTAPQEAPPTVAPQGYRLSILYTDKGFYLFNPGDRAIEPGGLSFEALDTGTGSPAGFVFTAQTWLAAAGFYPKLEAGKCDAIEINRTSAFTTRPAICADFNALVTPEPASPELFWLPRPNVSQFRVLWDSQEIARCEVSSGACDLSLPGQ